MIDNLNGGVQVGTNQWMAPEIMMGSHYDEKVDVLKCCYVMVYPQIRTRILKLSATNVASARDDKHVVFLDSPLCYVNSSAHVPLFELTDSLNILLTVLNQLVLLNY